MPQQTANSCHTRAPGQNMPHSATLQLPTLRIATRLHTDACLQNAALLALLGLGGRRAENHPDRLVKDGLQTCQHHRKKGIKLSAVCGRLKL